jgi:hypothetical protein
MEGVSSPHLVKEPVVPSTSLLGSSSRRICFRQVAIEQHVRAPPEPDATRPAAAAAAAAAAAVPPEPVAPVFARNDSGSSAAVTGLMPMHLSGLYDATASSSYLEPAALPAAAAALAPAALKHKVVIFEVAGGPDKGREGFRLVRPRLPLSPPPPSCARASRGTGRRRG